MCVLAWFIFAYALYYLLFEILHSVSASSNFSFALLDLPFCTKQKQHEHIRLIVSFTIIPLTVLVCILSLIDHKPRWFAFPQDITNKASKDIVITSKGGKKKHHFYPNPFTKDIVVKPSNTKEKTPLKSLVFTEKGNFKYGTRAVFSDPEVIHLQRNIKEPYKIRNWRKWVMGSIIVYHTPSQLIVNWQRLQHVHHFNTRWRNVSNNVVRIHSIRSLPAWSSSLYNVLQVWTQLTRGYN